MEDKSIPGRTSDHRPMLVRGILIGVLALVLVSATLAFVLGSGASSVFDAIALERQVAANERQALLPSVLMAAEAEAREAAAIADARAARSDETAASQLAQENVWRWFWIGLAFLMVVGGALLCWQYILYRQALLRRMATVPNIQTDGNVTIITPPNGVPLLAYQNLPAIAAPQVQNGLALQVAEAPVVNALAHAQAAQAAAQFAIAQGTTPAFLQRAND